MARESETDFRAESAYWGSNAVTPSDSATLPQICRNIYAAGAGTIKVRLLDGSTPTFNIAATSFLGPNDLQFDMVFSTGTTATGIIALF